MAEILAISHYIVEPHVGALLQRACSHLGLAATPAGAVLLVETLIRYQAGGWLAVWFGRRGKGKKGSAFRFALWVVG